MAETMKAVRYHEYGGPEVLKYEDAPKPTPKENEVLLRVHAAGVNPVAWKIRQGLFKAFGPASFPVTPGEDVAGTVESLGPGAQGFAIGDAVFGMAAGPYAEYAAGGVQGLARKPESLDFVQAAAIPVVALTAWQALDAMDLQSGQKVLIHGAAGGLGSFAVQLAKLRGAYVIATASNRNKEFLEQLGADEFVDYSAGPFEESVHDVDAVLETIGGDNEARSWQTLKKGGVLVSVVGGGSEQEAAKHGVRGVSISMKPNADQLRQIAGLVDNGSLKVFVETVLPLAEAAKAQQMSQEGHTRGKIVLRVE